jgi:hypothetical protein
MICDLIKTGIPKTASNMNNIELFTNIETILLLGSPVSNFRNYIMSVKLMGIKSTVSGSTDFMLAK